MTDRTDHPNEPTLRAQAAAVLERAAANARERGVVKGRGGSRGGPRCALFTIDDAASEIGYQSCNATEVLWLGHPLRLAMRDAIGEWDFVTWSDTTCRDADELADAFLRAKAML